MHLFGLSQVRVLEFNELVLFTVDLPLVVLFAHGLPELLGEAVGLQSLEFDGHVLLIVEDAFSQGASRDLTRRLVEHATLTRRVQTTLRLADAGLHRLNLLELFFSPFLHEL